MAYFAVASQPGDVETSTNTNLMADGSSFSSRTNGQITNTSVTSSSCRSVAAILSRFGICVLGVGLGFLTIMPNMMMSDSGSPKAIRAATIGMIASLLLVTGGVVGCIYNSWWCLLPGFATQAVALIYLG